MSTLPRGLRAVTRAVILLSLADASFASGDTNIPGATLTPLNTTTQGAIDAGLAALGAYDPASAAEIGNAVNNGSLDIAELNDPNLGGFKGLTDGNTISVRLNDGVDAGTVGIRLRHEWYHWKYGTANGPFNGGWLDACGHFQAWSETYDHMAYISCEGQYIVTCARANNVLQEMEASYQECLASGGTPVWPTNAPTLCCQ